MSYEAWRISFQSSEQAARWAYGSILALQSRIDELEKDAARYRWLRENESADLLAEDVIDDCLSREA